MKINETAGQVAVTGSRARITIISPGQGSSGFYPPETIAEAAPLFTPGTHMYLDHATPEEKAARPAGSLSKLVGVFESAAELMPDGSLEADVKIFPTHREFIKEAAPYIGVSISGDGEFGVQEGKTVVERLTEINSVDFVTKAGRGGKVLSLLEAHRPATEATADNIRDWLKAAVHKAYPYAWVYDYDAESVFIRREEREGVEAVPYTLTDTGVNLTGTPAPVSKETVYHPITESEAPKVEITEAEYKHLTEAEANAKANTGKIAQLEAQIEKLTAQLETEKAKAAKATESAVRAQAAQIVEEAFTGIEAPKGKARLIEAALAHEAFDAEAFAKTAAEEASEYAPNPRMQLGGGTVNESATPVTSESILAVMKGAN